MVGLNAWRGGTLYILFEPHVSTFTIWGESHVKNKVY